MNQLFAIKIKLMKRGVCGAILIELLIATTLSLILIEIIFNVYTGYQRNREFQAALFELMEHGILASDLLIEQIYHDKSSLQRFYVDKSSSALYFIDSHHYRIRVIDGVRNMQIRYVRKDNTIKGVDICLELIVGKSHKNWYTYVPL